MNIATTKQVRSITRSLNPTIRVNHFGKTQDLPVTFYYTEKVADENMRSLGMDVRTFDNALKISRLITKELRAQGYSNEVTATPGEYSSAGYVRVRAAFEAKETV